MSTELFETQSLKKLDNDQLVQQIIDIKQQSDLLTWLRWATLRSRFNSTNEFGDFLKKYREDEECILHSISMSTLKRFIAAGRLAEKLKLEDFNKIGMTTSTFYYLAEKGNRDIAVKLYRQIRGRGYTLEQVKLFANDIRQEESVVATIEHQEEEIDEQGNPIIHKPTPLQYIPVDKGVIKDYQQTDIVEVAESITDEPVQEEHSTFNFESIIKKFTRSEVEKPVEQVDIEEDEEEEYQEPLKVWDDSERLESLRALCDLWNVSFLKKLITLKTYEKELQESGYKKRISG
jgi:hypothetical protein